MVVKVIDDHDKRRHLRPCSHSLSQIAYEKGGSAPVKFMPLERLIVLLGPMSPVCPQDQYHLRRKRASVIGFGCGLGKSIMLRCECDSGANESEQLGPAGGNE